MADLIASWSNNINAVPESHVIPVLERPLDFVPISKDIPIIDLEIANENRALVIQQIMRACDEYACFQVINHGVPEELMEQAMMVLKEFFALPVEEKESHARAVEPYKARGASLYSSGAQYFGTETYRYWRDILQHPTNPGGDDDITWPHNPPKYREVIGSYSAEVRKLSKVILGLIGEGIGLEKDFFEKELGQGMLNSHYPACPDPNSTLGVGGHCDPNLITLIQQQVYGLQLVKDGQWIGVEPMPNAFFVNAGLSLTVISNGKLAAVAHRVVTNKAEARYSIGNFIYPEEFVEPAKSLVGPNNPPIYKCFNWGRDLLPHYLKRRQAYDEALNLFKIDA